MKCKRCKREIADNSIFCNWCGHQQLTASNEVRVPKPTHKSDTWFANIMVDGQRTYVSGESEEDYYAQARALKAGLIEKKKAAPRLTLGTAIDKYLKDNGNLISPSTLNGWESYRRTRFKPYMDMDIGSIPYQKMINDEAKIVSGKTVINAYDLVRHALDYAKYQRPQVKLPKKKKSQRAWLDYQQIQILLDKCKGKPYELGILLGLHGLRRSEILHLTADDIDTDRGLIYVRGAAVVGTGNKLVDKDTNKTTSSSRSVHIVIPRLNDLIEGKKGKLITTNPTTLYGNINRLCEKNGLPKVGVHGLRHSFASLAHHLKWDELTTMREGGWDDPTVVHEIYTHLASQDANEDIQRMKKFYSP